MKNEQGKIGFSRKETYSVKYILTVIVMILSNCTIVMTQVQASQGAVNALFCNVIVVKIPLTLLGEFLLEANFRMFYFSKGSFVRVITLTMTHPMI